MYPIYVTTTTTSSLSQLARPTVPAVSDPVAFLRWWAAGGREQVVILDPSVCSAWGLQPAPSGQDSGRLTVPGMKSGRPGPWITYRHDGGRLHVGFWPWMAGRPKDYPLLTDLLTSPRPVEPVAVLRRIQHWRDLFGRDYHGTPGVAGVDLLRSAYDEREGWAPRWSWAAPITAHEPELTRWTRPDSHKLQPRVILDTNRAYLAAMGSVNLAAGALEHTGPIHFDPCLSGWWLVEAEPWRHIGWMPDPLCRQPALPGQHVWVTTPTLQLFAQLCDSGAAMGYRVLDSWTGHGRRVLRQWVERVDNAYRCVRPVEGDKGPLAQTLKGAYRQMYGLFNHEHSRVFRPDWHYTIIGQARSTMLRKIWRHGFATDEWPYAIATDAISYAQNISDHPGATCPDRKCPILHTDNGEKLGYFHRKPVPA